MNEALELLHARFIRHLEYEETHLSTWLPAHATTGAEAVLGDHDEQRSRIRGLAHDRAVFGDPRTVAREALAFVHHLRAEMDDEDGKLRALG
jgi:hypothetical protein